MDTLSKTGMERVEMAPGLEFSRIVYGTWRLGDDSDTSPGHIRAKIEASLDQGITTIDQADIYGGYEAEELLGNALKGSDLKDRIEIVTKCGIVMPAGRHSHTRLKHYDTGRAHIEHSVDHSLRLMGVEKIDLLLVHRPDPLMDHHETGRALDDVVASGKVRAVGVSNFRPWDFTLLQSAMHSPLITNQVELSLLSTDPFVNGDLAFLQERGLRPMAWSPLGGGALVRGEGNAALRTALARIAQDNGTDVAAVAVAWLLAHPAGILPVLGTNNLGRIGAMNAAMRTRLDRQDWFELYSLATGRDVP